jgi:hypothetical protein
MNTDADTTEMNEAERREAVEQAPGLDDPGERDDESASVVEVE